MMLFDFIALLAVAGFGLTVIDDIDFGNPADVAVSLIGLLIICWIIVRLSRLLEMA